MSMLFPVLHKFDQAVDAVYGDYSEEHEVALLRLLGAPTDLIYDWARRYDNKDLTLTDQQVRLCELLAGPHGITSKRMLEVQQCPLKVCSDDQ